MFFIQLSKAGVKMLTTGEIAKLLHVSSQTVINWLDDGRIPFERIGRGPRRVSEINILRYIEEQGISPEVLNQTIYNKILRKQPSNHMVQEPWLILDEAGIVVAWNPAIARLSGYRPEEAVGMQISSLLEQQDGSDFPAEGQMAGETRLVLLLASRKKYLTRAWIYALKGDSDKVAYAVRLLTAPKEE
jgi:excisionase family DNA binding protein